MLNETYSRLEAAKYTKNVIPKEEAKNIFFVLIHILINAKN